MQKNGSFLARTHSLVHLFYNTDQELARKRPKHDNSKDHFVMYTAVGMEYCAFAHF